MSLVLMIVGGYLVAMLATLVFACALGRAGARTDEAQDRALRELDRADHEAGSLAARQSAVGGEREREVSRPTVRHHRRRAVLRAVLPPR